MDREREEQAEELFGEVKPEETSDKNRNLSELMEFEFDDILMEEPKKSARTEEERDLDGRPVRLSPEQQEKEYRKERRRKGAKIASGVFSWVKEIVIALVVVWFILTFVAQNNQVRGSSMQPTVYENDTVIVNKFIYRFQEPKRGDIIIFPTVKEDGGKEYLIKRIIGMPGDTIDLRDGKVYINDIAFEEDYVTSPTNAVSGQVVFPVKVPEGRYFVLGDNRSISKDSRWLSIGMVSKDAIVGKASLRIWPLDSIGVLN